MGWASNSIQAGQSIFVESGYERVGWFSVVEKSLEFEGRRVPKFLLKTVLRILTTGYAIYVFKT